MQFQIDGIEFRIEFQHLNRDTEDGSRRLHHTTGLRGLTTCVLISGHLVAMGTALCSDSQPHFEKAEGRKQALLQVLRNTSALRPWTDDILAAYECRLYLNSTPYSPQRFATTGLDGLPRAARLSSL